MLGDKIRHYRKLSHFSQEELAEKLGVSRQSISLWENNQTQPSIENIVVLAKLFQTSTDALLTTDSEKTDNGVSESFSVFTPSANSPLSQTVEKPNHPNTEESENTKAKNKKAQAKKATAISCVVVVALLAIGFFIIWMLSNGNVFREKSSLSAEEIYTKISPSVVEISAESTTEKSTGSGFFFDEKGTVVTNYHVIENCQTATITTSNGTPYKVTSVLGYNASKDIAILSTTCKTSKPLLIRSDEVRTGEKVYALGSSLGLTGSLSDGIISAVNRNVEGNDYIQTTAPVSHGNSGGPLVDVTGEVVGIICASFAEGQNLNLAIPITAAKKISLNKPITLEKLFPKSVQEIEWISDWRFQYYEDEDTYVLLFQLTDQNETPMSAHGAVDVRIVNDNNVTVYDKTLFFTEENFEEWIYDDTDEKYLATIYISPSNITKGSTPYGTVYFKAYGMTYGFDECTISVFGLPTDTNSTPNNPTPSTTTQPPATTNSPAITNPPATQPTQYTCLERSCKNIVSNNGDYCSDHKCATSGCSSKKDTSSNYCVGCACATVGCKNSQVENGYHCTEHTCAAVGCTLEKSYGSPYCFSHTCASCDNIRVDDGLYCINHTCSKNRCNSDKKQGSEYCIFHTCMAAYCKNETLGDGDYCEEHTCIAPGCENQKLLNDYCYFHTP